MTHEVNLSPLGFIKSAKKIFMKKFIRNKRKEFFLLRKQFHNMKKKRKKKKEKKREQFCQYNYCKNYPYHAVSTLFAKETSNSSQDIPVFSNQTHRSSLFKGTKISATISHCNTSNIHYVYTKKHSEKSAKNQSKSQQPKKIQ